MNAAEIVLIILGFLSISISFFLGSKEETDETSDVSLEERTKAIWTPKEEQLVKERICLILNEEKDNTLAVTTDLLNRKSNEKIIEFDEFAKPLMEKIRHNHEEVVFMYNMLTEKEKEWKEAAKRQVKPVPVQLVSPAQPAVIQEQPVVSQAPPVSQTQPAVTKAPPISPAPAVSPEPSVSQIQAEEQQLPEIPQVQEEPLPERKPQPRKEKIFEKMVQEEAWEEKDMSVDVKEDNDSKASDAAKKIDDLNKQIITLHKQGKSVLEISKELNVGQGEVKLTIALYGGNK